MSTQDRLGELVNQLASQFANQNAKGPPLPLRELMHLVIAQCPIPDCIGCRMSLICVKVVEEEALPLRLVASAFMRAKSDYAVRFLLEDWAEFTSQGASTAERAVIIDELRQILDPLGASCG